MNFKFNVPINHLLARSSVPAYPLRCISVVRAELFILR
jgi:hypothetical protein